MDASVVDKEVAFLKQCITRLGTVQDDGRIAVSFGVLFDDEAGQDYFEAIMGTLRAAKKRKVVDFEGQMLLKGAHDKTMIYLLES